MKFNLKSFVAVAASVAALAGCQKNIEAPVASDTVEFIAQSMETKTAFGAAEAGVYPTLWTANDSKVKINLNGSSSIVDATVIPAADNKTANFRATITDDNSGAYTFRVVSPSTAALGYGVNGWTISVPTSQTPTAASVDEAAQIIVAKSDEVKTFPTAPVPVTFSHFTSYGKLSILNLEAGATISSVTLTADSNWAGRYNVKDGVVAENSASKTITVTTTSAADIWFACAPVDLRSKSVVITVTTNNGDYKKTVNFPADKGNFQAGRVANFSVDFAGVTTGAAVVYSLVTSKDALTVGSKVIIASGAKALSTTQNSNNRGAASVTVADNKITNPSDAVQILEVKSGAVDETIALYTGDGYLYAASSSSNYMKTQSTLNANGSFAVSFSGNNINLTGQGTNTRNIIKYNSTNSVFSCYSSGQSAIQLYKLDGSGSSTPAIVVTPSLTAPTATATANDANKTIRVTWTDVENATSYLVECGSQSQTVNPGVQEHTFTMDAYGTYDVYVTAQADGYKSAKSAKASAALTDPAGASTATVTFTPADFTGQGTSGTGGAVSATKSGITFAASKGYGTTQLRAYSGSTVTVTSTVGNIKSITFTFSSGSYKGGLSETNDNINKATWSATASGQARITEVVVEYFN